MDCKLIRKESLNYALDKSVPYMPMRRTVHDNVTVVTLYPIYFGMPSILLLE